MSEKSAYFDASVLVRTYVEEAGSARGRQLVRSRRVLTSSIAGVEMISAFRRNFSEGHLSERAYSSIARRFAQHRLKFRFVELTGVVLEKAEALVSDFDFRALDAVHLASAIIVRSRFSSSLPFITADARQRDVAEKLGMEVIWVD